MLTKTINKILLAGLLSAAVLVPVVAQKNSINSNAIEEETSTECAFDDLELPDEFVVYAAGGYGSVRRLDFQIDKSGDMTGQMDLVVNSPSKPVVLMLGVHEPNIWNIKWTEGTEIVAVLASGYSRQAVAGLPKETPILTSTHSNGAKCGYFYLGLNGDKYEDINPLSEKLFGQSIEEVVTGTFKWIGELPEDEDPKLLSSDDTTIDSFYNATAPLAGFAGVEAALEKGILRRATPEDVTAWIELQQKLYPKKNVSRLLIENEFDDAYVILDNFTYPKGRYEAIVKFFIPKDVPQPKGNSDAVAVYNFNTGKCSGPLCDQP